MATKDVTLCWTDQNIIERGYKVYRSKSPMVVSNMPPAIATLSPENEEFIDIDQPIGDINYYQVSAWIDDYEVFSEEYVVEVKEKNHLTFDIFNDNIAIELFNFNGDTIGSSINPFSSSMIFGW